MSSINDGTDTAALTYNAADQVTQLLDTGPGTAAGGDAVALGYDGDGNLVSLNGDGVSSTITYDADRQVASVEDSGIYYYFSHDKGGHLISAGPSGSPTVLGYDADGHLTGFGPTADPSSTSLSYDADGNLVGISGPGGSGTYTYNGDGTLASVSNTAGQAAYSYDQHTGLLDSEALPGGVTTTYQYDATHGDELVSSSTGTASGPPTTTQYVYDAAGHLLSPMTGTRSTGYTYDSDGRVVQVAVSNGPTVTVTWAPENRGISLEGSRDARVDPRRSVWSRPAATWGSTTGSSKTGAP